jgi:hypothetical protein
MDRRKKPQKSTEERNAIIEELVRDREPGAPQAPKRKPKKKKSTVAKNIILSIVFILLLFTGYKVYDFVKSPLNAAEPPDSSLEDPIEPMLPAEDDEFAKKRINILVLGVDEREGEPARSDTIYIGQPFP